MEVESKSENLHNKVKQTFSLWRGFDIRSLDNTLPAYTAWVPVSVIS